MVEGNGRQKAVYCGTPNFIGARFSSLSIVGARSASSASRGTERNWTLSIRTHEAPSKDYQVYRRAEFVEAHPFPRRRRKD
jgi:hypothetical protein